MSDGLTLKVVKTLLTERGHPDPNGAIADLLRVPANWYFVSGAQLRRHGNTHWLAEPDFDIRQSTLVAPTGFRRGPGRMQAEVINIRRTAVEAMFSEGDCPAHPGRAPIVAGDNINTDEWLQDYLDKNPGATRDQIEIAGKRDLGKGSRESIRIAKKKIDQDHPSRKSGRKRRVSSKLQ